MRRIENYTYYQGESQNPFNDFGRSFWWDLEREAALNGDRKEKWELSETMTHYLKEKMWQGDSTSNTTYEDFYKRILELYNKGLWSRNYICVKGYTIQEAIKEPGNKETISVVCRYYKGEEDNPYKESTDIKNGLWFYESCWAIRGGFDRISLEEYICVGLEEFMKKDNVPITLKALLFNRWGKGCYSMLQAAESFKDFYKKHYVNV